MTGGRCGACGGGCSLGAERCRPCRLAEMKARNLASMQATLAERKEAAKLKPQFLGCPSCGGPKHMRSRLCRECRRTVIGERALALAAHRAEERREGKRRALDQILQGQALLPAVKL